MNAVLKGASGLLLLWPVLVWYALSHPTARWMLLLLALPFILRWLGLRQQGGAFAAVGRWLAVAGAGLCAASILLRNHHLLLWYPLAVNAILLLLFAASLFSPMPVIERLARLHEAELPPRAILYTRRVTQLWCLFFIFNGAMALVTCLLNSLFWWTLWNGCISYLLIGLLMMCEWLARQRMRASL